MADKRFTIQLDAQMNISQVKSAVQSMQTELNKLNLPPEIGNKIGTTLGNLSSEIERFQAKAAKGIGSTVDFTQISRSGEKIIQLYEQLRNQVGDLGGLSKAQLEKLFPPEAVANIKKANAAYETYTAAVKKNSSELSNAQKSYKETSDRVENLKQKLEQLKNVKPVSDDTMSGWKKGLQESAKECEHLQAEIEETKAKMQAFVGEEGKGRTESTARKSSKYRAWEKELQELTERYKTVKAAQIDFESKTNTNITFSKQATEIKKYESQLETAQNKLQSLSKTIQAMGQGNTQAFGVLISALNQINDINLDPAKATIEDVQRAISGLTKGQTQQLYQNFDRLKTIINSSSSTFGTLGQRIDETETKVQQLDNKISEVNALKSRINYFFGLTNSVYLFKRAISNAFETVKELDATMTEAAVVTDFSVSDMWNKLPQYANEADKLGTSINSLYGATTLYYQQGLKSQEAMALGIETMKMARIAGMESAEATEAMTAALRGFNMELNEFSATRINDVYSNLAAITAADTEQIATAMSKTASIAASANMEFETTAALLAQIVETTQEAPETAGTAMKTIIARFTEVKELFSEGMLTGEDSEGEEININKIDTALKTVGISLKDFLRGNKGIDDIFLELASKWDSLDLATQRYIATMAAGSRQQSRFIAMMSNYDRTMELVSAANNSAGASQRQFNKTLDSLDAKLEQLQVAWDQFLMGIANNEIIKDAIGLLTELLKAINEITTLKGKSSDAFSLISKLGITYGGMKIGKKVFDSFLTSIVANFTNSGEMASVGFFKSFQQQFIHRKNGIGLEQAINKLFTNNDYFDAQGAANISTGMQQIAKQYNLTEEQANALTEAMKNNGQVTKEVNQISSSYTASLKAQRKQQIKTISSMIGIIIAVYAILAITQKVKEKTDETIETTEEKMASLQKIEDDLIESTTKLSKELEDLADTKKAFKDMVSELKKLKKGSSDWASAMHNARTQMLDILETYPDLKQYTETINGITVLTEKGWMEYELKLLEAYYKQMQALYGTKIQNLELEKISAAENLNIKTNTISETEQQKIIEYQSYGNYIGGAAGALGGWIAGTAIATKIGGAIGTAIAPGLGTAVGAVLGLALGGLLGGALGGEYSATEGIAPSLLNDIAMRAVNYSVGANQNFSAQEVAGLENSEEIIAQFLEDSGLQKGSEQFEEMFNYISNNAEEFDRHSKYLMEANAQLLIFGQQLGQINGESKGYTGEAAETYTAITAMVASGEYNSRYSIEYDSLVSDAKNAGVDINEEGFSITDETLINEFMDFYGDQGFEFLNNKIYYEGRDLEISNATFLGKLAAARVGLDIEGRADQIFDLVSHDPAVSQAIQWFANDGKLTTSLDGSSLNLAEIGGILKTGWKSVKNYQTLGDREKFLWKVFQNTASSNYQDPLSPVGYNVQSNTSGFFQNEWGEYKEQRRQLYTSASGLTSTETQYLDPQNYKNFTEYAEAAKQYQYKSDEDMVLAFAGTLLNLGGTWATDLMDDLEDALGGPSVEWEYRAEDSKADYVDQKGVEEWAKNNGYTDDPLAWLLFWSDSAEDYLTDMQSFTEQYDKMMQWTYSSGHLYTSYDENGNSIQKMVENGYGFEFLAQIDWESASAFISSFEQLQSTFDMNDLLAQNGKTLSDYFNDIAGTLTNENQLTQVMNLLATTDFTNLTELRALIPYLSEIGVPKETIDAIETMTEDFKEAGIAIAKIDLDTLISQIEATTKVIDKINDLEIGETIVFSEEEYNTMLSSGVSSQDFFATVDGYVYLGDSVNSLRDTLIATNSLLLGLQVDALRTKIKTAEQIEKNDTLAGYAWGATSTWSDKTIQDVFGIMVGQDITQENWGANYLQMSPDQIRELTSGTLLEGIDPGTIAHILGGKGMSNLSAPAQTGISELLLGWGDAYINKAMYQNQLDTGITSAAQQELSVMTGQQILQADENTYNIINEETGETTQDNISLALDQKLKTGQLEQEAENVTEALQEQNDTYQNNSDVIKAAIVDSNNYEKQLTSLAKVINDNEDALSEANKGTERYQKTLDQITTLAKQIFGDNITEEFVEDNLEAFQDWAKGGEGSAEALRKIIFDNLSSVVDITDEKMEQVSNIISGIDGLNFDIYGHADADQIFSELTEVMGSAEDAAAAMRALGYSVSWEPSGEKTPMTVPDVVNGVLTTTTIDIPHYRAVVTDGLGNTEKDNSFNHRGGGGGGGGGSKKWENPYDKLHNVLEEINDLLREREKLERRYQRLVDQGTASAEKLSKISNDNISNYQDEIAKQEYIIAGRKAQVQAKIKANPDMEKYVYTDIDAMGNETIRIDWDAINAITDSEEGEKVSAFYDDIDEWLESIYDAEESILEAEDGIWEELQQGKDEYLDLEEQVKEAIVNQRQEEIDKLSAINDSINDTNSRLLEAMQSSIDKYRQDRENQKTEEELSDKQRRLAYLQQDTSGANDLEIMKLQEEIDQGQQDYTDSLIDQKISELQEQNDKAAEQRQQQIDIMQAQLDKYVESGEIWQEVSDLIATGTDAAQNLVKGSELETLLKSSAGFEGMSNVQKMAWLQDTNVLIAQALKWLSDGAVSSFSTGQEVTFKTGDGKTITGKANAQGEVEADGQIYKDVSMDAYGNYSTKETVEDAKNEYTHRAEEKKKAEEEAAFNARFPFGRPSDISRNLWRGHSGTDVKALQQALNELGFNAGEVDGIFGGQTWNALTKFKNKYGGHGEYGMQSKTKAAFKAIEYKTGGLADFTGPAWLDGTRSKPEYILNADQTKAFFTLVDVLGSLQAGNSKTAQNSGDNTYDIDINVESIGSDYDVEQLATTVKRLINEDARYRNNNTINLMR